MMPDAGNLNTYEYLQFATGIYDDVWMMQHFDVKYKRSEVFADIEALAGYFQKVLKLKKGDVYTVFMPTTMEGIISFYALNSIGVIANFVHPLMSADYLKETINDVHSKGIMILDILFFKNKDQAPDYVKVINESGLPVIITSPSYYAEGYKKFGSHLAEKITKKKFLPLNNYIYYSDVMFKRIKPELSHNNGDDISVYLNGGGTTGKSKTIKLTNKAINELVARVSDIDEIHDPGEEAEVIVLPMFHCFGLCVAIHMAMCNSGRVIPMMQFDSRIFCNIMKKHRVIGFGGIPLMFAKLMKDKNFDGPWLKNIRLMFCGGDDVSDKFIEEFNSYFEKWGAPGRLYQGYGLTEVGSVCCTNSEANHKKGSIGKALRGVTVELWDDDHNPVKDGEIGEFAISGPTIMEGYYVDGCEDEHLGVYIDKDGKKWVLSGDLGYKDEDGYYFFSGRKKRVIIIAGYNVYPNDIEKALSSLEFIKEACAVQGWAGERSMVRLFVSLKHEGDRQQFEQEIRKTCVENFSKFYEPKEIVFLDELPQTPLMKVDFMKLTQHKPGDPVYPNI